MSEFSSEGFDLDAISDNQSDVLEIGGGISKVKIEESERREEEKRSKESKAPSDDLPPEIIKSEEHKKEGNELFKQGLYLDAIDEYTNAINICPYEGQLKGKELLTAKMKYEQEKRDDAARKLQEERSKEQQERRKQQEQQRQEAVDNNQVSSSSSSSSRQPTPPDYEPPKPLEIEEYKISDSTGSGEKYISVYYCNRAACYLHLKDYDKVIDDCTVSLLFKPNYTKALMRRSQAYENYYTNDNSKRSSNGGSNSDSDNKFEFNKSKVEDALKDAQKALELEPNNRKIQNDVKRLEVKHNKEMEELKEKTMSQLKDLGNSILGNFGLSLDNFQAKQDPKTGSYSINFNQNA